MGGCRGRLGRRRGDVLVLMHGGMLDVAMLELDRMGVGHGVCATAWAGGTGRGTR